MSCRCYEIGGPFIAEDPDCELHKVGGLADQLRATERRLNAVEEDNKRIRSLLRQILELPNLSLGDDDLLCAVDKVVYGEAT